MSNKPKFNYINSCAKLIRYDKTDENKRKEIVNKRLQNLINYSKENSEFYKKLYENIDTKDMSLNNLSSLPPTNKLILQKNFNDWTSNPDLTEEKLNEFLSNPENYTKKYLNKYSIYQTSGTTGAPVTVINDDDALSIAMMIGLIRSWYHFSDVLDMVIKGTKRGYIATCILPVRTPCISTFLTSIAKEIIVNKKLDGESKITIIDMEKNMSEIVDELNKTNPVTLAGYVTFIEMLCDEADKGNLKINPLYVTTVGEKLTKETKERINKTFNCVTLTNYACTECAEIAHMCTEGHYHINDDWIIVEPVDENNNLIKDGEVSNKILVTNLWNYIQPFIRYEMNDRCIMHHEPCTCGNKSPWLEVEGREFKVLSFKNKIGEIVKISPISIELIIHEKDEGINKYQFILNKDIIEIKLLEKEGYSKEEIFNKLEKVIKDFLFENGLDDYKIILSKELPSIDKSGKFKQVYQIN